MRSLSLAVSTLHLIAVVATSGVTFCVGEDGHAAYELIPDECCEDGASCCGGSGGCDEAHFSSAGECGDCTDRLAPVGSGIRADDAIGAVESSEAAFGDERLLLKALPRTHAALRFAPPGRAVLRC
jgi:hypothetical protein